MNTLKLTSQKTSIGSSGKNYSPSPKEKLSSIELIQIKEESALKSQKTFAAGGHRLNAARFRKEKNTMAEFRKNIEAKQSMAEQRRNLKRTMGEIQKDVL